MDEKNGEDEWWSCGEAGREAVQVVAA